MQNDEYWMEEAVQSASANALHPFGAILVSFRQNELVASGVNRSAENPSWHGEIDAINQYASKGGDGWSDLTLYTTAEPCPMCQAAVLWAGIRRVVYGISIPRLMELGWRQIDIRSEVLVSHAPFAECQTVAGVLQSQCDLLFRRARDLTLKEKSGK